MFPTLSDMGFYQEKQKTFQNCIMRMHWKPFRVPFAKYLNTGKYCFLNICGYKNSHFNSFYSPCLGLLQLLLEISFFFFLSKTLIGYMTRYVSRNIFSSHIFLNISDILMYCFPLKIFPQEQPQLLRHHPQIQFLVFRLTSPGISASSKIFSSTITSNPSSTFPANIRIKSSDVASRSKSSYTFKKCVSRAASLSILF